MQFEVDNLYYNVESIFWTFVQNSIALHLIISVLKCDLTNDVENATIVAAMNNLTIGSTVTYRCDGDLRFKDLSRETNSTCMFYGGLIRNMSIPEYTKCFGKVTNILYISLCELDIFKRIKWKVPYVVQRKTQQEALFIEDQPPASLREQVWTWPGIGHGVEVPKWTNL